MSDLLHIDIGHKKKYPIVTVCGLTIHDHMRVAMHITNLDNPDLEALPRCFKCYENPNLPLYELKHTTL